MEGLYEYRGLAGLRSSEPGAEVELREGVLRGCSWALGLANRCFYHPFLVGSSCHCGIHLVGIVEGRGIGEGLCCDETHSSRLMIIPGNLMVRACVGLV